MRSIWSFGKARHALRNVDARRAFDFHARSFGMHLHRLDAFFVDRGASSNEMMVALHALAG